MFPECSLVKLSSLWNLIENMEREACFDFSITKPFMFKVISSFYLGLCIYLFLSTSDQRLCKVGGLETPTPLGCMGATKPTHPGS